MTDLIFQNLTAGNLVWARLAAAAGWDVRFLGASPAIAGDVEGLKRRGIRPVDFEKLDRVDPSIADSDSLQAIDRAVDAMASDAMLTAAARLVSSIKDGAQKIRITLRERAELFAVDSGRINCWIAGRGASKTYVVLDGCPAGLIDVPGRRIVRIVGIGSLLRPIADVVVRLSRRQAGASERDTSAAAARPPAGDEATVAFFPHQGLAYGNLFRKDHFYSERSESQLHPSRLLHIDLHNRANPDPALRWVALDPGPWLPRLKDAFAALRVVLPCVRSWAEVRGAAELAMAVARIRGYSRQLARFPALKIALLDHDILFPKSVTLALQSRGIATVAMQDRFSAIFSNASSVVADVYLAASPLTCATLRHNRNRAIDSCVATGLVRSDKLFALPGRTGKGRCQTVVALPYHSRDLAIENAGEPFMTWKSHRIFLADILRLAKVVPDHNFVIRGKNCDWMAMPEFSDIVAEVNAALNVLVSTNYDRFDESYRLCAEASLVIAKHTSLGDECISAGIPTVFHDYGANYRSLVAPIFDYGSDAIWAHDAEQLDRIVTDHLLGRNDNLQTGVDRVRDRVFGNLADGRVKARMIAAIERLAGAQSDIASTRVRALA